MLERESDYVSGIPVPHIEDALNFEADASICKVSDEWVFEVEDVQFHYNANGVLLCVEIWAATFDARTFELEDVD